MVFRELSNCSDEDLVRLKDTKTYRELAFMFGTTTGKVYEEFRVRGILNKKHNRLGKISDQKLIQYRKDMYTYDEIGKMYGVTGNTVRKEYENRGILEEKRVNKRLLMDYSDKELILFKEEYRTYENIARKLNMSLSVVYREYARRKIVRNKEG